MPGNYQQFRGFSTEFMLFSVENSLKRLINALINRGMYVISLLRMFSGYYPLVGYLRE